MITQVSKLPLSSIPPVCNLISTKSKFLHFNTPFGIFLHTNRLHSLSLASLSSQQASIPIEDSSKEHSFTVNYLINSCGLSLNEALSPSTRVKISNPTQADIVLSFFKNYGFPQQTISLIVRRIPSILNHDPEKRVLPILDFFCSQGLSVPDIIQLINDQPIILVSGRLENRIIPAFRMLKVLFKSDNEVINTVKSSPEIFRVAQFEAMAQILIEAGVSDSTTILTFFTHDYVQFKSSAEYLRDAVEEVKRMGIELSGLKFVKAVRALSSMSKSTWERKAKVFEQWGLSKDEFFIASQKSTKLLMSSEGKINRAMEFFVKKLGFGSLDIALYHPWILGLNFEKLIIPRCLLYQIMLDKGLVKSGRNLSPFAYLRRSDKTFFTVMSEACEMEAPEIMKLHQEIVDIMLGKKDFDLKPKDTSSKSLLQEVFSAGTRSEEIELFIPYLDGSE